jgi:hypothetical protein
MPFGANPAPEIRRQAPLRKAAITASAGRVAPFFIWRSPTKRVRPAYLDHIRRPWRYPQSSGRRDPLLIRPSLRSTSRLGKVVSSSRPRTCWIVPISALPTTLPRSKQWSFRLPARRPHSDYSIRLAIVTMPVLRTSDRPCLSDVTAAQPRQRRAHSTSGYSSGPVAASPCSMSTTAGALGSDANIANVSGSVGASSMLTIA